MLCLIGGFLFPNKSTRYVHLMWLPLLANFNNAATLSWGSACLAWLYRELCCHSQSSLGPNSSIAFLIPTCLSDIMASPLRCVTYICRH
ncbi:Serine/threonine-protein phosphatase 7 long form homolog [Linum perenne]